MTAFREYTEYQYDCFHSSTADALTIYKANRRRERYEHFAFMNPSTTAVKMGASAHAIGDCDAQSRGRRLYESIGSC